MANAQGGSFIPKRSTGKVKPSRTGKRVYVFSFIAYIIFFGTLITVLGLYFLNNQAENQLQEHIVLLSQEQESFENSQLDTVRDFKGRLDFAGRILDAHIAVSRIFDEIEPVIVETVQLSSFTFARDESGRAVLSLGGLTETFDVLLFQRNQLRQSDFLSSADFVEVTYGEVTNDITGSTRDREVNSGSGEGSQITFVFEDTTIEDKIGYQPRSGFADDNTDTSEVETDATASEESDGEADATTDTTTDVDSTL